MNILLATSRGGGLETLIKGKNTINKNHVILGAPLSKLTERATTIIPPRHTTILPSHVYILAGVPDISKKIKGRKGQKYTECIYTDTPDNTIASLITAINTCADTIKGQGATPIFCTITDINIKDYNTHLLKEGKTLHLHHTHQYENMQASVEFITVNVNNHIITINKENGVSTPFLHMAIKQRRGQKPNHYYKTIWNRLKDGVHGTYKTRKLWADSISSAIKINRGEKKRKRDSGLNEDDEVLSPKRSWKKERQVQGNTGEIDKAN